VKKIKLRHERRAFIASCSIIAFTIVGIKQCYPAVVPTIFWSLVCLASIAALTFNSLTIKQARALREVISKDITKMISDLTRGLSTFASGDLRTHLEVPDVSDFPEDVRDLAERLRNGMIDFNTVTDVPSRRICFTGANSYREGTVAGRRIADILGGKGRIVSIIPAYTQVNHVLRMKGCLDYLGAKHPGISVLKNYPGEGNRDVTAALMLKILAEHPDVDLVYITDGHTPPGAVEATAQAGRTDVRFVFFDAVPENVALLKAGRVSCLIEQNSFAQAYNAVVNLYNACETDWKPLSKKLFMEPIAIDRDNLSTYWDDVRNERVLRDEENAQLAVPERRRSDKRYRLGILLPHSVGFFEGLGRGAEAARALLAEMNVEVEVRDLFNDWNDFGQLSVFGPAIKSFVERGFDGFATVVVDPRIVDSINQAVAAGLKVTTFNTEPSSFREIVITMIENIESLADSSQALASAAEESSRANAQIGSAITGIRDDIGEQKRRIDANDSALSGLNGMIAGVGSAVEDYSSLVSEMTDESGRGSEVIDTTYRETETLKTAIDETMRGIEQFNEKLKKVEEFAGTIEKIAESTNVLAINASIQASRAGTAGKGFAVVAGEVRSLAENSARAAEGIRGLVGEINADMRAISEGSSRGAERVAGNLVRARDAKGSFDAIVRVLNLANEAIGKIDAAMDGIEEAGKKVKTNMDAIDDMSRQTVNRVEEITQSVRELGDQSAHLSQTANELRAMAVNQDIVFSQLSARDEAGG